jgi:(p)ppGpp synthase/HD superfamily hydrolase
MMIDTKINWIINQHRRVNHFYDDYIPYEFHLRMVVQAFKNFKHLIPEGMLTREEKVYHNSFETVDETLHAIELACWGHDMLEDVHGISYNDVKDMLGENAADIIYACTNEKGKNRKERGNSKYYEGIRNTPGAVFVKLCDRIANAQYSKMTGSRMFEMYKKENPDFELMIGRHTDNKDLEPMFAYLSKLFEE